MENEHSGNQRHCSSVPYHRPRILADDWKQNYMEDVKGRRFDTAWSFGAGVEVLSHLQVSASYGLGLTKALKTTGATSTANIEGHNRYWTVTAAYLF